MVEFKDKHKDLTVWIEEEVLRIILLKSSEAYPNETGGFLVGKYTSDKIAYISLLIEPAQKHGSPSSYKRSTKGMKKIWDELYSKGYIYLGEWHSHPTGTCQFSQMDLNSMKSIALSQDVYISKPLMLIISINREMIAHYQLYHYEEGNLLSFEKMIKNYG